jgi:hypothetical protein
MSISRAMLETIFEQFPFMQFSFILYSFGSEAWERGRERERERQKMAFAGGRVWSGFIKFTLSNALELN